MITNESTLNDITLYFTQILSTGSLDIEKQQIEIHIFLITISNLLSKSKKQGYAAKLMRRHYYPGDSLYKVINNTIKEIECINNLKYFTIFYSK